MLVPPFFFNFVAVVHRLWLIPLTRAVLSRTKVNKRQQTNNEQCHVIYHALARPPDPAFSVSVSGHHKSQGRA
jgi:hypothetical protein